MKTKKLNFTKCVLSIEGTQLEEMYNGKTEIAALMTEDKFYDAVTKEEINASKEFIIEKGKTWEEIAKKNLETIFTESVDIKTHNLSTNIIFPIHFYSNNLYSDDYAYCLEIRYKNGTVDYWSRDSIEECYYAALNQEECGYKGRLGKVETIAMVFNK